MLSKKHSNNVFLSTKRIIPLLILILMNLSGYGKNIKEQTSEIPLSLFIIHSLLQKKVMGGRPRWRYLGNKKTINIPFPVGRFIFFNLLILPIHIPRALLLFPVKAKEHPKETLSLDLLLKQVNLPINIFPFFKKLERMKTLPIMVKQV